MTMKLAIAGANGRMGRVLARVLSASPEVQLVGGLAGPGSSALGQDMGVLAGIGPLGAVVTDDAQGLLARADGVIDFTVPAATLFLAGITARLGRVHVIGTTGFDAAGDAVIAQAATQACIVKSGNMSLGVNVLAALVRQAAKALSADYDIEVVEMHHRNKIDAPSGTALLLGQAAAEGRGIDLARHSQRGRDGITGARAQGDIGFAALRGGSVIGDHTVILAGAGERLEFSHKAENRDLFAQGALKAALWAQGKPPGLYSMMNVLGLE